VAYGPRLVRLGRRQEPYDSFRRFGGALEMKAHPRMNEPSERPDTPARPQDYAGLRAELAELASDFTPVITPASSYAHVSPKPFPLSPI
jgi:hypothetical protein